MTAKTVADDVVVDSEAAAEDMVAAPAVVPVSVVKTVLLK